MNVLSAPARRRRPVTASSRPLPTLAISLLLLPGATLGCTGPGAESAENQETPGNLSPETRVVSLDYGMTETLLGLGVVPVGVPDIAGYEKWVVEPALPDGVVDVGSTFEPNLELIEQLEPDLIVTTPFLAGLRQRLERIAPTLSLSIYTAEREPYRRARQVARTLGDTLDREAAADSLVTRVEATLERTRRALREHRDTPLYFVRFMDPRHVRVFSEASLFDDVLERVGIPNAWDRDTNAWGYATVGIEALAGSREARLFYLEPLPPDVLPTLEESGLWARLPFVEAGRVHPFPMVLMFGGLPAAERFAEQLAMRLEQVAPATE